MTETDEKHENPTEEKPTKQGLQGWKAALAIFGCGTAAAFVMFGAVISVLGLIFGFFSSGGSGGEAEDQEVALEETTKPRSEFESDKFDLCGRTLPAISSVGLDLTETSDGPVDTSIDGGDPSEEDLVRSDECSGTLSPGADSLGAWDFDFSYRAIIYAPDRNEDSIAQQESDEIFADLEDEAEGQVESGEVDFLDGGNYVYSELAGDGNEFSVVALKRSAIIEITMVSPGGNSVGAFTGELQNFEGRLDMVLTNLIPE